MIDKFVPDMATALAGIADSSVILLPGFGNGMADALLQGYERSPHLQTVTDTRGEELAVGIERAAAFLASSSRTAAKLKAAYTCGGGARVPGLNEALGTRLRIPVTLANPLHRLRVRDGAFESLVIDDVAPLLMLPIGLALRQVA